MSAYKTTTVTVIRPSGATEVVDISASYPSGLTDAMFAKMVAATKAAGRGEMVSYSVVVGGPSAEVVAENAQVKFMKRNGFSANNF